MGLFLFCLFFGALNARAQTAREIQMTPTLVYASDFAEATGAGVEVTVELSNLSNIAQNVRVSLYNENVRLIAFVHDVSAAGASSTYWGAFGGGMFYLLPALENSFGASVTSGFVGNRSSFEGQYHDITLESSGNPNSVRRIQFYFSCDVGMGRVLCRGNVPAGDGDYNQFRYFANRLPHNYTRSPNPDCRKPGWWLKSRAGAIPGSGGNANQCFNNDAGNGYYDPNISPSCERRQGDGINPHDIAPHTDFLCKMEFFYRYGIRVSVNQARGAVSGSVTHRTFALGGGNSRVGLSHESIPLNGGRPF